LEDCFVYANTGGDSACVDQYVQVLNDLIKVSHVLALVVDVEQPVFVYMGLVAVVSFDLDPLDLLLE
jgi:hypothetical protein